jgi:hypothetical protein
MLAPFVYSQNGFLYISLPCCYAARGPYQDAGAMLFRPDLWTESKAKVNLFVSYPALSILL